MIQSKDIIFEIELAPREIFSYSWHIFIEKRGWIFSLLLLTILPSALVTRLLRDTGWYVQIPSNLFLLSLTLLGDIILISIAWNAISAGDNSNSSIIISSLRMLPFFLITRLIQGFLTGFMFLLIIPGVIYLIYWFFVPQVVVLKGLRFGQALAYSKTIVSGRWRKVFIYSLLFVPLALPGIVLNWLHFFTSHPFIAIIYEVAIFPIPAFYTILFTLLFLNMEATTLVEELEESKGILMRLRGE